MINIIKITDPKSFEVNTICALAELIWNQHYISIISKNQIEYMLRNYQSKTAVERQLRDEGFVYYLAYIDEEPVGYSGIVPSASEHTIFLSKLYILERFRRMGVSRSLLSNIFRDYPSEIYSKIFLTCNKHNESAINAYLKMGFVITDSVVTPIGNGMVMDDYVLTLTR